MSLTTAIKEHARALGFERAGIVPVGPARTHAFYTQWLAAGMAGEMGYLHRHAEAKTHLARVAPGARSAIVLTLNYHTGPAPESDAPLWGRVSRYAWGRDYHDVIDEKLRDLAAYIERRHDAPVRSWRFVDAAPLMEREWAARAGLGWVGKNGVVIQWRHGSWLFIAELLVDVALEYDAPLPPRRGQGARAPSTPAEHTDAVTGLPRPALALRESCGSCRACIDACPTGAIVAEKTVDSRRCISYHTIELKGAIPTEYRAAVGEWLFGCDICQDVCPWNRHAPRTVEPAFDSTAERAAPPLPALLALDEEGFRRRFRGTPLTRPKRRGMLRNAAIVLGNRLRALEVGQGGASVHAVGVAALAGALQDHEPVVRGAAAWALGQAGGDEARTALEAAAAREGELEVRQEIEAARDVARE